MLSLSEVRKIYNEMSTHITDSTTQILSQNQDDTLNILTEYITGKFPETSPIFAKFDSLAMLDFCKYSQYPTFEENQEIFKKGEECQDYYFI